MLIFILYISLYSDISTFSRNITQALCLAYMLIFWLILTYSMLISVMLIIKHVAPNIFLFSPKYYKITLEGQKITHRRVKITKLSIIFSKYVKLRSKDLSNLKTNWKTIYNKYISTTLQCPKYFYLSAKSEKCIIKCLYKFVSKFDQVLDFKLIYLLNYFRLVILSPSREIFGQLGVIVHSLKLNNK